MRRIRSADNCLFGDKDNSELVANRNALRKYHSDSTMTTKKKASSDPGTRTKAKMANQEQLHYGQKRTTITKSKKGNQLEKYTSISQDRLMSTPYKVKKGEVVKKEQKIFAPNIQLTTIPARPKTEVKFGYDPYKYVKAAPKKNVHTSTFSVQYMPERPLILKSNLTTKYVRYFPIHLLIIITDYCFCNIKGHLGIL